ncbi:ARF-binding protein [Sorochytrium milnesiophthora]
MYLARLANNRNSNVSLLALTLLDNCVKNCGYPFHLQLAAKDFLNELVKRFPAKPPQLPTSTQLRILELIQEWNSTLAQSSKNKADMQNIADMYRLLTFKGYRFPGVAPSALAVLQQGDTLKSADEMEEEDTLEKKAKLQELLRRATPNDLEEANRLMKELVGYVRAESCMRPTASAQTRTGLDQETRNKVNYKQKVKEELDKIEMKAKLMDDMLNGYEPGQLTRPDDALQEMLTSCKAAQPKIRKFIEDEYADKDLDRLLALNDIINGVLTRYDSLRQGSAAPAVQSLFQPKPQAPVAALIDLDEPTPPSYSAPGGSVVGAGHNASVEDLLSGLSFQSANSNNMQGNPFAPAGGQFNNGAQGAIFLPASNSNVANQAPPRAPGSASPPLFDFGFPAPSNMATSPGAPYTKQVYSKNGLLVQAIVTSRPDRYEGTFQFSNRTLTVMSNLHFQVAASKVSILTGLHSGTKYSPASRQQTATLSLGVLSSQLLAPNSQQSVTQSFSVHGSSCDRLKFRLSFESNGVQLDDQGDLSLAI